MKKHFILICTLICAALSFTSCNGLLTALNRTKYIGTKSPDEGYEAGDILFSDGSSVPYDEFIETLKGGTPNRYNGNYYAAQLQTMYFVFYTDKSSTKVLTVYGSSGEIWESASSSYSSTSVQITENYTIYCPSIDELTYVYKQKDNINAVIEAGNKYLNTANITEETLSGTYWSATEDSADSTKAKALSFDDGSEISDSKTESHKTLYIFEMKN